MDIHDIFHALEEAFDRVYEMFIKPGSYIDNKICKPPFLYYEDYRSANGGDAIIVKMKPSKDYYRSVINDNNISKYNWPMIVITQDDELVCDKFRTIYTSDTLETMAGIFTVSMASLIDETYITHYKQQDDDNCCGYDDCEFWEDDENCEDDEDCEGEICLRSDDYTYLDDDDLQAIFEIVLEILNEINNCENNTIKTPEIPDLDLIESHVMQVVNGNAFAEEVWRAMKPFVFVRFNHPGGYVKLRDVAVGLIANLVNPSMISYQSALSMVEDAFDGVPKAQGLLAAMWEWGNENGLSCVMHERKHDAFMLVRTVSELLGVRIAEAVKDALEEQSMLELLDDSAADVLADI